MMEVKRVSLEVVSHSDCSSGVLCLPVFPSRVSIIEFGSTSELVLWILHEVNPGVAWTLNSSASLERYTISRLSARRNLKCITHTR